MDSADTAVAEAEGEVEEEAEEDEEEEEETQPLPKEEAERDVHYRPTILRDVGGVLMTGVVEDIEIGLTSKERLYWMFLGGIF